METVGSSYNAPRLHVAMQARKIVVSGEAAGLQIQLGPPAVPGRFDSCDLPPISLFWHSPTPCNTVIPEIFYLLNIQSASGIPDQKFCDGRWATEESACRFFCPRTHPRYARQHVPCLFAGDLPPAGSQPTVSPLRWRYCFTRSITPFFIRRFYSFNSWRKKLTCKLHQ